MAGPYITTYQRLVSAQVNVSFQLKLRALRYHLSQAWKVVSGTHSWTDALIDITNSVESDCGGDSFSSPMSALGRDVH
jgi:hypothetical protein